MRGLTGRGMRVAAVVGVLLLGSGAVTAVADDAVDSGTVIVEPAAASTAEAEPDAAAEAETATPEATADPTPADETDPTGTPTPTEEPAPDVVETTPEPERFAHYWSVVLMHQQVDVDWRAAMTSQFPDIGAATLQGVSAADYGTVEADLAAGTIVYTAPMTKPVGDDGYTITALGADGASYTLTVSVVLVWPTTGGVQSRATAVNTPVRIEFEAPERTADGAIRGPEMPALASRASSAPGATQVRLPALSLLPDAFVEIGAVDPAQGSAVLDGGVITFTPAAGFVGVAEFPYTVEGAGGPADGVVRVSVLSALHDATLRLSTPVNTTVDVDGVVAAAGGSELAYVGERSTPGHGTLNMGLPAYGLQYTPATGYTGSDSFTVRVRDAAGQSATVTVLVSVGELPRTGVGIGQGLMAAGATVLAGLGLLLARRRVSNLS